MTPPTVTFPLLTPPCLGVAENEPEEIAAVLKAQHELHGKLIAQRRAQNERLWVWRFSREPIP